MKRLRASCLLLAAALGGCSATVTTLRLGDPAPPRPRDSEIRVYTVKTPDCPYEEIALLTAFRDPVVGITSSKVIEALKRRTRQLGGDAVLGLTTEAPTQHSSGGYKGTAVRFTDASCRADPEEHSSAGTRS